MKFVRNTILLAAVALPMVAFASSDVKHPEQVNWAFDGVLGKNDKVSVQRGLQVYREVCAACHSLKRVPFRSLQEIGLSEDEVKALAAEYTVNDGPNDDGEMFERPGRASDKFPSPYANDKAARAMQNGALPPDLSLMIKARPDGANYVYSLLTGYAQAPTYRCEAVTDGACVKFAHLDGDEAKAALDAQAEAEALKAEEAAAVEAKAKDKKDAKEGEEEAPVAQEKAPHAVGQVFQCSAITHAEAEVDGKKTQVESCTEMGKMMHYNPYFPGRQIAMAPPIADDQVTYQDDTKATKQQVARDIVNFLQWAAEPEMEARKRMGLKVMIFIGIMTGFFYLAKKRIWSNLEH